MPRIVLYFGLPLLVTILFMFALRPLARGMGLIDRIGPIKDRLMAEARGESGELPLLLRGITI